MTVRVTKGLLFLSLATFCSPLVAQEQLPEEKAAQKALEAAIEKTEKAWSGVEKYGRKQRVGPEQARALALKRLESDSEDDTEDSPAFDPKGDYQQLSLLRERIIAKLRRLAPGSVTTRRPRISGSYGSPRLKIFDVQDLIFQASDYYGPNVGLGVGLDRSGASASILEEEGTSVSPALGAEKLLELAEAEVGDDNVSLEISNGRLLARCQSSVHTKLAGLLKKLRQGRHGLIDLELRVYRMPAKLFIELRKESLSLSDKAEARLVQAQIKKELELLASHRVVAHDGQQVFVRRGGSQSIVADLEVNQTGVVPVINPVVSVVNEGMVVEVRPILNGLDKTVMLDVALSISELDQNLETRKIHDIDMQMAKMRIARTSSTSILKLGRGALLGGAFRTGTDNDEMTCVIYVKPKMIKDR